MQIIIQKELEKSTEILQENLILKTQNFLSKLDIFKKLKKKRIVSTLVFLVSKTRAKNPTYVSQKTFKRRADLLLIEEEGKKHYFYIKELNTFMFMN